MKKLLVTGLLVVSVAVFAKGYNNYSHMYNSNRYETGINQNLTSEQNKKLSVLEKEAYNSRRRYALEIQTKNLEVQRMMNEDKVNWSKVEKINGEIANIQAKMRTESMKFNRQAYDITGYEHMNRMSKVNGFCEGGSMGGRGHMY
ncbi:Spy/CpxP family protein refolding chaperone [Ilyobacter sp.]|uniref:Spy/CpxP family protein refolding chaperone n=1 Tax=Ilyobacter sp. TaxID=3100343 RepID=UPI0035676FCB